MLISVVQGTIAIWDKAYTDSCTVITVLDSMWDPFSGTYTPPSQRWNHIHSRFHRPDSPWNPSRIKSGEALMGVAMGDEYRLSIAENQLSFKGDGER